MPRVVILNRTGAYGNYSIATEQSAAYVTIIITPSSLPGLTEFSLANGNQFGITIEEWSAQTPTGNYEIWYGEYDEDDDRIVCLDLETSIGGPIEDNALVRIYATMTAKHFENYIRQQVIQVMG